MPLAFNQFVRAIRSSGGAAAALPALTSFAQVGDSLTQFSAYTINLASNALNRDAAGTVTFTKTAHAIYGPSTPVFLVHCTDTSYEGDYTSTSVDANNLSLAGGVAGSAGTSSTLATGVLVQTNRLARRGLFPWLNSARGGALALSGIYGQAGNAAEAMGPDVVRAIAKNTSAIILVAGINNIYGGAQNTATAWANVKARIDQIVAGGRVAICCAITPVSSVYGTYSIAKITTTQEVNALMQAYCAANPASMVYVDIFTPLYDSATQQAYSWATSDGIHWTTLGAKAVGEAVASAIASATATAPTLLPVSSTDTGTPNGWTRAVLKGPWTTATGGTLSGLTGSAPPGTSWTRSATGTGVASIVDPGDGKGIWAQAVFTPAAAAEQCVFWPWTNTAPTIASLGIATTDTVRLACEVEWSGAVASNLSRIELTVDSRTAASPFVTNSWATDGNDMETVAGRYPDTGSQIFVTGPLKLDASVNTLSMSLAARFFASSASALTLKVRRVCLLKL